MKQVSFSSRGQTVRGWVHCRPDARHAPVIALCHGFTGNCSEHGLFEAFCEQAAAAGFYALRFDCVGSGDSEGDFAADTYLSGWRDDILAALDYAAAQPETDGARMGVLGISMGAGAALLTAAYDTVQAAAAWAPVLYPQAVFYKIMGAENWDRLLNGQSVQHSYAGVDFAVSPRFAQQAEQLSVQQVVQSCGKPVLLRFGLADLVIDPRHAACAAALEMSHVTVETVEGETHGFCIHQAENIERTLSFFKAAFGE